MLQVLLKSLLKKVNSDIVNICEFFLHLNHPGHNLERRVKHRPTLVCSCDASQRAPNLHLPAVVGRNAMHPRSSTPGGGARRRPPLGSLLLLLHRTLLSLDGGGGGGGGGGGAGGGYVPVWAVRRRFKRLKGTVPRSLGLGRRRRGRDASGKRGPAEGEGAGGGAEGAEGGDGGDGRGAECEPPHGAPREGRVDRPRRRGGRGDGAFRRDERGVLGGEQSTHGESLGEEQSLASDGGGGKGEGGGGARWGGARTRGRGDGGGERDGG